MGYCNIILQLKTLGMLIETNISGKFDAGKLF
jgi:hypothetical protein